MPTRDRGRGRRWCRSARAPGWRPSHPLQPADIRGIGSERGAKGRRRRPRVAGSSSPAVRSKAISGLWSPAGRARLAAARTGKWGPPLSSSPARHKARQSRIGLRQRLVERRGETEHAPASADEVEARHVTGEHGRMTLAGAQLHPDPQQHAGNRGAEPGRQHDGVAQGPWLRKTAAAPSPRPGRPRHAVRPRQRPGGTVRSMARQDRAPEASRQVRAPVSPRGSGRPVTRISGPLPPSPGVAGQPGLGEPLQSRHTARPAAGPSTRASSSREAGSALEGVVDGAVRARGGRRRGGRRRGGAGCRRPPAGQPPRPRAGRGRRGCRRSSRPGTRHRPGARWCPRTWRCGWSPGTAPTGTPRSMAASTVCREPPWWRLSTTTTTSLSAARRRLRTGKRHFSVGTPAGDSDTMTPDGGDPLPQPLVPPRIDVVEAARHDARWAVRRRRRRPRARHRRCRGPDPTPR